MGAGVPRPLADKPTVTSRVFIGLREYLSERGVPLETVLAGADPFTIEDPFQFCTVESTLQIFEAAGTQTGDESFGLHFAQVRPGNRMGLFHYILMNAPTLREVLRTRNQYAHLVESAYGLSMWENERGGVYAWDGLERFANARQFTDFVVTAAVLRIRNLLADPAWTPRRVDLAHSKPDGLDGFRAVFGPNLVFDAPINRVTITSGDLDRAIPGADPVLFRELKHMADGVAGAPNESKSLSERVRTCLTEALPSELPSEVEVARALGLSKRSLQRALKAEGLTFAQLVDSTRRALADRLLRDTDVPLTQIAFMVGFSELSGFSRAARAWFGVPASEIRRQARGEAASAAGKKPLS